MYEKEPEAERTRERKLLFEQVIEGGGKDRVIAVRRGFK